MLKISLRKFLMKNYASITNFDSDQQTEYNILDDNKTKFKNCKYFINHWFTNRLHILII